MNTPAINKSAMRVFVSYSESDSLSALRRVDRLRKAGFRVWLAERDVPRTANWPSSIQTALDGSQCVIALMSEAATHSEYCQGEVLHALEHGKEVIPVLVQRCTKPFFLAARQHIDFTGNTERGYMQLEERLRQIVSKSCASNPCFGIATVRLRSTPMTFHEPADVQRLLEHHGFYSSGSLDWDNPEGTGIVHDYQLEDSGSVVVDHVTGLCWQRSGSHHPLELQAGLGSSPTAMGYLEELNQKGFGGYRDWRIPTLEEAMSVLEVRKANHRYCSLHIDTTFLEHQERIFTADTDDRGWRWYVDYKFGYCSIQPFDGVSYRASWCSWVRAVRSGEESSRGTTMEPA